jgi:hypothetical protein
MTGRTCSVISQLFPTVVFAKADDRHLPMPRPVTQSVVDQRRNLAFLMLRKEMTFRLAAFEYTAALERGTRILASDDVLEGAYADMTFTIRSWAEVGH